MRKVRIREVNLPKDINWCKLSFLASFLPLTCSYAMLGSTGVNNFPKAAQSGRGRKGLARPMGLENPCPLSNYICSSQISSQALGNSFHLPSLPWISIAWCKAVAGLLCQPLRWHHFISLEFASSPPFYWQLLLKLFTDPIVTRARDQGSCPWASELPAAAPAACQHWWGGLRDSCPGLCPLKGQTECLYVLSHTYMVTSGETMGKGASHSHLETARCAGVERPQMPYVT